MGKVISMSVLGSQFHSRVFGFHTPRSVILAVLGIITAYFYWNNDLGAAIILSFVLFVIGAFNIAVDANKQRLRISALWIPVRTIPLADIQEIELLDDTVFPERATLGTSIANGEWSYHSGPATMRIITHSGGRIRVTVDNPEALLKLVSRRMSNLTENSRLESPL